MESVQNLQNTLEEILTPEDLEKFLQSKVDLRHYIGFEISGQVHLGSGIMTMRVIKQLQKLGIKCHIWLADWHSVINNKLGGDPEVIREMAISYFKEAMIASAMCVGVDVSKLHFVLANDIYDNDYWLTVMDVAKNVTLSRSKRSVDVAGRAESEDMKTAILFYPMMQVADIYFNQFHVAHAGSDQRKAHVVARDVAFDMKIHPLVLGGKNIAPLALHHHLLMGLAKPTIWPITPENKREALVSMKMSKSKPNTAVFITDSPDEIRPKILNAFCPPAEIEYNPIIDWAKHIIFPLGKRLEIKRLEKWGGDFTIDSFDDLVKIYSKNELHPQDLKNAVAEMIIEILSPARDYFSSPKRQAALEKMKSITITR